MSTTEYFSEDLDAISNGKTDESTPSIKAEILVSSYSGEYKAYFKIIENDGTERLFLLTREQLSKLHGGVHSANSFFTT